MHYFFRKFLFKIMFLLSILINAQNQLSYATDIKEEDFFSGFPPPSPGMTRRILILDDNNNEGRLYAAANICDYYYTTYVIDPMVSTWRCARRHNRISSIGAVAFNLWYYNCDIVNTPALLCSACILIMLNLPDPQIVERNN
jgi:hypothetical protein